MARNYGHRRTTRATSSQPSQPEHSSQSQSDLEPQSPPPPAKSQRTPRKKATGAAATVTRRRLRSAKESGSPLQSLNSPELRKTVRKKREVRPVRESSESDSNDGAQAEVRAHARDDAQPETQPTVQAEPQVEVHREVQTEVQVSTPASAKAKARASPLGRGTATASIARKRNESEPKWLQEATNEPSADWPELEERYEERFGEGVPDADRGKNIFFQIRMRNEFLYMTGVDPGDDYGEWMDDMYRQCAIQYHINEVDPLQAHISVLQNRVAELEPLEARSAELESRNEILEGQLAEMEALKTRNAALEIELKRSFDFISMTGQVEIDPFALGKHAEIDAESDTDTETEIDADPTPNPNPNPPIITNMERPEVLHGSESAIALLRKIEKHKRFDVPQPQQADAAPKSPEATDQDTPMVEAVETPKQQSLFGRVFSALKSPFSARARSSSPQVQQPDTTVFRTPLTPNPPPVSEFTLSLTPTPTPIGERSVKSRTKTTKSHRQAVVKAVANSVQDSAEKEKARIWAEQAFEKITLDVAGNKRKRLEQGVKVADLKNMYACKPWMSSGGYGMDDDLYDLSDSDDAPAWAVLQDMVLEQEAADENPAKRVKQTHDTVDPVPAPAEVRAPGIFNSGGKTCSPLDVRPRSSRVGSPMFDMTVTPATTATATSTPAAHQQNENVFTELDRQAPIQQVEADKDAASLRDQRRSGHVAGSGSFSVPEHSSDEEDGEDEEQNDSTLWTQEPPPAPTPAHASLPNAPVETPSVPAAPVHPADAQRAKLAKHTPAKPSRLREVTVPSPSVRSDAGNESIMQSQSTTVAQNTDNTLDMSAVPDADSLDISPEDRQRVDNFINSTEGQAQLQACDWDDPVTDIELSEDIDPFSDVDADL